MEIPLQTHFQVACTALAALRAAEVGYLERQRNLELALRAEAVFPQKLVHEGILVAAVHRRGQHDLVLGIRLLREQRPGQIELAARPTVVRALGSYVIQDRPDLLRLQRVAEGRHHAVETPHRATGMYHRVPVGVRLPGGEIAVGEVRHLKIHKTELRNAVARTVAPVACRACSLVQLGAGFLGQNRRQTGQVGQNNAQGHLVSVNEFHFQQLSVIIRISHVPK